MGLYHMNFVWIICLDGIKNIIIIWISGLWYVKRAWGKGAFTWPMALKIRAYKGGMRARGGVGVGSAPLALAPLVRLTRWSHDSHPLFVLSLPCPALPSPAVNGPFDRWPRAQPLWMWQRESFFCKCHLSGPLDPFHVTFILIILLFPSWDPLYHVPSPLPFSLISFYNSVFPPSFSDIILLAHVHRFGFR